MSPHATAKPGIFRFLRAVITLQTLAVFMAPVTAGLMLSGSLIGHTLHSAASYTVFTVVMVHVVTAILIWRPGRGSLKPLWSALVLLGLVLAQVFLGIAHVTTLHLPLAFLLFGLSIAQTGGVWGFRRQATEA